MILTCLASGSSGNCYVLKDNKGKMLLLDAGIPIMKIKKGCSWKVSDIVGCVVTHKHRAHSEAVSDLEEMGIPVYKPYEDNSYIGGYGEFRIVLGFQLAGNRQVDRALEEVLAVIHLAVLGLGHIVQVQGSNLEHLACTTATAWHPTAW